MPICPECESDLNFEPDEVDEGDVVTCDECGSEFEVVATDPIELANIGEDDDDYDGDSSDEDEDDDDDEEDED